MATIRLPLFNICGEELVAAGYVQSEVVRAYEELYEAFGEDWIEEQFARKSGGILDGHPLLAGMGSAGMPQIVQALEVAVILRRFAHDPALPSLVGRLRDWDQFGDVYYALRIGLRFTLIGFRVQLEPETVGGKADILAHRDDLHIGIESTAIRWRFKGRTALDSFNAILHEIKLPPRSVLEIVLRRDLTRETELAVCRLIRDLLEKGTGPRRSATSETATVSLRPPRAQELEVLTRTDDMQPTQESFALMDSVRGRQWDLAIVEGTVRGGDPNDPRTYDVSEVRRESVVKVRFHRRKRGKQRSLEDKIDRKVSSKLGQIRSHPREWTSALFLNVPYDLDSLDAQRIWRRLAGDQLARCENLSAVFVTQNRWTNLQRNQLWMLLAPNAAAIKLFPPSVVHALGVLEGELDFARLLATS
jgi:hypothetical protein